MILPLEKQVCALKYSKRFKELGVKQGSLFYWCGRTYPVTGLEWLLEDSGEAENWVDGKVYSAFTVAELGEMLPNYVSTCNCGGGRNSERVDYAVYSNINSREAWIKGVTKEINWVTFRDRNEANARAKMLVYLLEHKLIEVNK